MSDPASHPSSPWFCVVVHGAEHVAQAMEAAGRGNGRGIVLLSAPAAAGFGGPRWWMALSALARRLRPEPGWRDILDCGDSAARALEAIRLGQRELVLRPGEDSSPVRHHNLLLRADASGALVLPSRPDALDLAGPDARARLAAWVDATGDSVQAADPDTGVASRSASAWKENGPE